MKLWLKYLIGILIGVLAAVLLPLNTSTGTATLQFLSELFIRFGRYIVVPLIFFTAVVSMYKLRMSFLVGKTALWTAICIIVSSFFLTLVGLFSVVIVKLPRIPITVDVVSEVQTIDIKALLLTLFPTSAFASLAEGSYLLCCFLFAILIGWTCFSDQNIFKPLYNFSDALSQLFYKISSVFTEVMSFLLIVIMAYWTVTFRTAYSTGIYSPMIALFVVDFILIVGIIYPLIVRYVCHEPHPYRVLYASIAPLLIGFLTGDENVALPICIRHGKESLGIRRRCGGVSYPLFSIFARGGSSLVAAISFVLIWRSYSSLTIPVSDLVAIFFISFIMSFMLGGLPSGGAFILLTVLCQKYGKGFETSFLLLKPATVIICSFATLFDIATAMFGSYIVAYKTKMVERHQLFRFI